MHAYEYGGRARCMHDTKSIAGEKSDRHRDRQRQRETERAADRQRQRQRERERQEESAFEIQSAHPLVSPQVRANACMSMCLVCVSV